MLDGCRPPTMTTLRTRSKSAWDLTHAGLYTDLTDLLRGLAPDLEMAARTVPEFQRAEVYELLAATYQACSAALAKLGEPEAAWIDELLDVQDHFGRPSPRADEVRPNVCRCYDLVLQLAGGADRDIPRRIQAVEEVRRAARARVFGQEPVKEFLAVRPPLARSCLIGETLTLQLSEHLGHPRLGHADSSRQDRRPDAFPLPISRPDQRANDGIPSRSSRQRPAGWPWRRRRTALPEHQSWRAQVEIAVGVGPGPALRS